MSATLGKIALGALIVLAAFVWLSSVHPLYAAGTSAPLSISLNQFTAGALASKTVTLPAFDETGIVFMDMTKTPAAPYIAYENANTNNSKNQLQTKALIFNDSRGCDVSAGEFPCARNIDESDDSDSDSSPIPAGTIVNVIGGTSDQAVIVQSYSTVSSLPTNMVSFQDAIGQQIKLSNGLFTKPEILLTSASCTLGIGCFGNGVDRLQTAIGNGTSTTTTDLVPGTIFVYGKSSILLLSLQNTESAGNAVATILVSASK